ncbi:MAG: Tim44 domain-containing protein [Gammaproteobacteria bacterium]|nr:Tim44 domain-containing protein [Gammaproteobacteria bacterium]
MKSFTSLFAAVLALALVMAAPDAAARRFASSKSFGKSYQTSPYSANKASPSPTQATGAPGMSPGTKGMLGGLAGGLLAGSLLGGLLGGGGLGGGGLQLMDILLFGGLAFLLFKFLRSRAGATSPGRVAYGEAGPGEGRPAATSTTAARQIFDFEHIGNATPRPALLGSGTSKREAVGFSAATVPFDFPPGFQMNSFLAGARDHYRALQEAWNSNDLAKIREYVAPEIYPDLAAERATLEGAQHTEVMFVDAEIVRAELRGSTAELSVQFTGAYRDQHEGVEEKFTDIWHLARATDSPEAPWYIVGIQSH